MSAEHLRIKLANAGIDEEELVSKHWESLLTTSAELVFRSPVATVIYSDPEVQMQRLKFELHKWNGEMQQIED